MPILVRRQSPRMVQRRTSRKGEQVMARAAMKAVAVALAVFAATPVLAAQGDRRIDILEQRIHQGERSGQLTRKGAWRLERQLADLQQDLRRMRRSDRFLSQWERRA